MLKASTENSTENTSSQNTGIVTNLGQGVFGKVLHSYMHSVFEATHTYNLELDMGLDRLGMEFLKTCFILIHYMIF